jgi:hypothetical protein
MIFPRAVLAVERSDDGADFDGAAAGLDEVEPLFVDEQPASVTIANAVPATEIMSLERVFTVQILSVVGGRPTMLARIRLAVM